MNRTREREREREREMLESFAISWLDTHRHTDGAEAEKREIRSD